MSIKVISVLATVPKHKGVATVVRVVEVAGERFVDIRDLISTPGEVVEGRGYLFPFDPDASFLAQLGDAIHDASYGVA